MLTVWTISMVHGLVGECKVCIRGAVGLEPVSDRQNPTCPIYHKNILNVTHRAGRLRQFNCGILVTASKGTLG